MILVSLMILIRDICARFACHLEGDKLLSTELSRSVLENLGKSHKYRPNAVRSADTPPSDSPIKTD